MKRKLNWKRDRPDFRDKKYTVGRRAVSLPDVVDLRNEMSPVVDQGEIGSCTGNAICGALEHLELRDLKDTAISGPEVFADNFLHLSRLFVYWNERELEGDVNQDGGAQIRDGMKTLSKWGICPETIWPYDQSHLFARPDEEVYTVASKHKISTYHSIDIPDLKECLASGYPFVFGFTVYSSFMSEQMAQTGIMSMPLKHDRAEGGHAVLCCGYNDKEKMYIVKNSWGTGWGLKGYFKMPYAYMETSNLCADFWTVRI